ncbi:MAG: dihydroorotate dehydrogenase 2, partial [bacterium]|nr:dihydroorotate dehydrogenase 2 [bacterium]
PNPIGLAAGFDYNGHLAKVMKKVGFGFNTVGTVTLKPYAGNPKPRLGRLPKSQSLFVNKGFRNDGVVAICKRLEEKDLKDVVLGISVGSAVGSIDEYLEVFDYLKNKDYVKYFELNISCPNLAVSGSFYNSSHFTDLVKNIKVSKPVFVKMPNEISFSDIDPLIKIALKYGLNGVILSNLVKDRKNKYLNSFELSKFKNLKGNFSGKPCFENSNKLIAHVKKTFDKDCVIIGCGGVFSASDAYEKIKLGADLVQMITGLIYEGPQIVGQINRGLVKLDI